MKTLLVVLIIFMGCGASAKANLPIDPNQFNVSCLSWSDVTSNYDLSQISDEEKARLQSAHKNLRRYLSKANSRFAKADEAKNVESKIMICAMVDEATEGFQYSCPGDDGQEMVSEKLVEACLKLRIPEGTEI